MQAECPPIQIEPVDLSVNKNSVTENGKNHIQISASLTGSESSPTVNSAWITCLAASPNCIDLRLKKEGNTFTFATSRLPFFIDLV